MQSTRSSTPGIPVRPLLEAITLAGMLATAAGCMTAPPPKDAEKVAPDQIGRPKLVATEAQSLQRSIMALGSTRRRVAFRERILAWPGKRTSAAEVAFVRLSDVERRGVKSVDAGDGMFDALRAATQELDETRMLAERSLFLVQRLPFLMRWHAEVYTGNTLATGKRSRRPRNSSALRTQSPQCPTKLPASGRRRSRTCSAVPRASARLRSSRSRRYSSRSEGRS